MNKIKLLISLLMGIFVLSMLSNASAQTAKIKTVPMTPRMLGTMAPGTNPVYSGSKIVAKGMKVYLAADTTGGVSTFSWSITGPAGSKTTLSSTNTQNVTFVPDSVGQYYVSLTVGSSTDVDTFVVATYIGAQGSNGLHCQTCHGSYSTQPGYEQFSNWQQSPHANIFHQGVSGQLEASSVNGMLMGTYSSSCWKCHTTGWDQTANNGNFGYLSHQSGYDTVWAKTYTKSGGSFLISTNDQTAWNLLTTNPQYSNAAPLANIGCESCHGPGSAHVSTLNPANINVTLDAGVCIQCHDAPTHHTIGTYYEASVHALLPDGAHTAQTGCFPCHSGGAYYKYVKNQSNPGWTNADGNIPISCATCHDPHDGNNFGLRIAQNITLQNGFQVTTGGNGQICMRCHQARKNGNTVITNQAPYYGFSDHYGPHHGPQTDMFFGQNAYQYGDTTITGLMTHGSVPDACVTCHMANIGGGNSPSHQWNMIDTTGGTARDFVVGCVNCHGPIKSFDDIKASSDWDGNGKIEGVQTEIQGMMNNLASLLPKDNTGAVTTSIADSLKVKNQPNVIKGIYTYEFVLSDGSYGVHNAKYTVALLQKALSNLGYVTPVEMTSFQANAGINQVTLKWETVTETNNKGFEIQRKLGNAWVTEGFVNGRGNSTEVSQYSYVDNLNNFSGGDVSYRLKQIDYNGKANYSKEVEVNVVAGPKEYTLSQNYPNPFNPSTTINFALPYQSNVKIIVYNITGAQVKVLANSNYGVGEHQVVMNASSLSSGVYFYVIEATSLDGAHTFRETKKMILMK